MIALFLYLARPKACLLSSPATVLFPGPNPSTIRVTAQVRHPPFLSPIYSFFLFPTYSKNLHSFNTCLLVVHSLPVIQYINISIVTSPTEGTDSCKFPLHWYTQHASARSLARITRPACIQLIESNESSAVLTQIVPTKLGAGVVVELESATAL